MNNAYLFSFTAIGLIVLGLAALIQHAHVLRKVLALNVMGNGVFLLIVAVSRSTGSNDPVPPALVITGIVVAVAATGVVLVLMHKLQQLTGSPVLPHPGSGSSAGQSR